MPGWHAKLKESVANGDVVELGLIQEQHPDRCKLFMQWKQMDWPIMVDSLNLLGVKVVPITLFIDEYGVIRKVKPKHEDLADFLAAEYEKPETEIPLASKPDVKQLHVRKTTLSKTMPSAENAAERRNMADQMFLWYEDAKSEAAARWYEGVLKSNEEDGEAHFRAGVALRRALDYGARNDELFAQAVKHWERALDIDPNHYIRRRRIQQYGPRLDKPYSFYDWINEARKDIEARKEEPVRLVVEPSGAEFAYPDKDFKPGEDGEEPDPRARIKKDEDGLIEIKSVPVPGKMQPGEASRVHLTFTPNEKLKAHWNNESGHSQLWVNVAKGWQIEKHLHILPIGEGATDTVERKVEFEVRAPKDAKAGKVKLTGYALYYVCEDADGTCLYLRQDFEVELEIK